MLSDAPTTSVEAGVGPSIAGRRTWLLGLVLFVAALAVYVPTAASSYANPDAYSSSLAAWRIATAGEPWMEGVDFTDLTGVSDPRRWTGESNGHLVTNRMYGPILAAVPFYWVAAPADEASFSVFRGGIAASTMVAGTVVLLFLSLRRIVGDGLALAGAGLFAFATPAWSVGADALWTHSMTMLGLAGAAYGASRGRWWLVGASLGFAILARPHIALVAAIIGLGMAWSRRNPKVALGVGIPTSGALLGLATWNHYVFGTWSPLGAYAGREVSASVNGGPYGEVQQIGQLENWAGFLISPDRGLLTWTPLLLILIPAVVGAWSKAPDWTRWLVVGGLAYSALQLALNWFGGGDGFYGYRHALELLVCLTPIYVFAFREAGTLVKALTPPIAALQFAAIATGAATQAFMLNWSRAWKDNSFAFAVRQDPAILLSLTAGCLVAGVLVSRRLRAPQVAD